MADAATESKEMSCVVPPRSTVSIIVEPAGTERMMAKGVAALVIS